MGKKEKCWRVAINIFCFRKDSKTAQGIIDKKGKAIRLAFLKEDFLIRTITRKGKTINCANIWGKSPMVWWRARKEKKQGQCPQRKVSDSIMNFK